MSNLWGSEGPLKLTKLDRSPVAILGCLDDQARNKQHISFLVYNLSFEKHT